MPNRAVPKPTLVTLPLRLGVSRCLLGEEVRYDGGHKRDPFLVEILGRYVEWVPVCPEVEAGLGTSIDCSRFAPIATAPRHWKTSRSGDSTSWKRLTCAAMSSRKIHRAAAWNGCGCSTDTACRAGTGSACSRRPS